MSELEQLPQATVRERQTFSIVWLVPLLAAGIGIWLLVITIMEQGHKLTITFQDASGLIANKTKIKYKEVDIGVVESIKLSDDFSHVLVEAELQNSVKNMLRHGAKFWVVRPRLSMRGASGLNTLMSGAYIAMEPGHGDKIKSFTGLETPPVLKDNESGGKYILVTDKLGSLDSGSPIYYRGINTGEVLGYELAEDNKSILIHVFIRAPFHKLVYASSRFWETSGLDLSMNSEGLKLDTESLQSLLTGGVAFSTPENRDNTLGGKDGMLFKLYKNRKAIKNHEFSTTIPYSLYFDGSVRGLAIGAPVEFRGIRIGTVTDIRMEFNSKESIFRIPVKIEIEPERIIETGTEQVERPEIIIKQLVERGLRARLQTGNYLTGQRFVELNMHPDTPIELTGGGDIAELPTLPTSLDEITSSITNILNKLSKLPLEQIAEETQHVMQNTNKLLQSDDIKQALRGANELANSKELRETITELKTTIAGANELTHSAELRETISGANKLVNAKELTEIINSTKNTLSALNSLAVELQGSSKTIVPALRDSAEAAKQALVQMKMSLENINQMLGTDAPLHRQILEMTGEISSTARSVRALIDYLERNPESMLFGKQQ